MYKYKFIFKLSKKYRRKGENYIKNIFYNCILQSVEQYRTK